MQQFLIMLICLNYGTPKTINFPFGTNGKLIMLDVLICKNFQILDKDTLFLLPVI